MAKSRPIPQLPGEEWRPVPGHEGYYEVSNLGRVRSITVLRPAPNPQGYLTVNIHDPSGHGNRTIHSLVAEAFIGPRPELNEVRHLDGTRLNNRADNLAYGTRQQNVDDMQAHGTQQRGEKHWNARLSEDVVSEIRRMVAAGVPQHEIARHFDIAASAVTTIASGKSWSHLRGRDHPLVCEDLPGEIWRPVPGYEGRYEVSDQGRLRSFISKGPGRIVSDVPQRVLRPRTDKYGYLKATLLKDRKHTTWSVHRIVALAFHGSSPDPELVVRHLDGNRANNRADNLQWGTPRENAFDRKRHDTQVCGERNFNAVLNAEDVRRIRAAYAAGALAEELGEMYHVSAGNIRHVCSKRSWKHVDGPITICRAPRSIPDAPRAKLTWEEVDQIRQRLASGESGTKLAREFGVTKVCVSKIKLGKTWQE